MPGLWVRVPPLLSAKSRGPNGLRDFLRPPRFDLIMCLGTIQCVAHPIALPLTLRRLLSPGGVVLPEVKDAAAAPPAAPGHSPASRVFAPLKAWASAPRGAALDARGP
jgi:hypothetical protein